MSADELELAYETGLEVKSRSQWAYARRRFLRHRLAMSSLVVLIVILGAGIFATDYVAPYSYDEIDLDELRVGPDARGAPLLRHRRDRARLLQSRHLRHPDRRARSRSSSRSCRSLIGVARRCVAGYYGGWTDNLLMRFTDLVLTLPGLAILLTPPRFSGNGASTASR